MKIAALMIVRDEEVFVGLNIDYHLDLGFDRIYIMDHCSADGTAGILARYAADPRVIVRCEEDPVFDHGRIANKLLKIALGHEHIDWFFLIDADEFLAIPSDVHQFIASLETRNIVYASIGWANALFQNKGERRCAIDTATFYFPGPERPWQHPGHFRKSIARYHDHMEVVVGGHYFRSENDQAFYDYTGGKPFLIPYDEASYLHFEFRDNAEHLYEKWSKLALNEKDSSSSAGRPWLERIELLREYVKSYEGRLEEVNRIWFDENHTLWGNQIAEDAIFRDNRLQQWCRSYLASQSQEDA